MSVLSVSEFGVTGLFKMYEQEGFPLADSLVLCSEKNMAVDWGDFYAAAKTAGWGWDKTEKYVSSALCGSCYPMSIKETLATVFDRVVRK